MPRRAASSTEDHFRNWLARVQSGCVFAALFGGNLKRVFCYEPLTAIDPDEVEIMLDQCAAEERVALLLFPRMRDAREVAELVRVLATHPRWRACVDPAMARDASEVGLRLTWTTREQRTTNAMGFAPLGYMPVTRRAPYVALAAWTGGHSNPIRTQKNEQEVTMGDAPPRMERPKYKVTLQETREHTARLIENDVAVEILRNLAFRLPRTVVEELLSDLPIFETAPSVTGSGGNPRSL
jgi:hypothetical protein